MPNTTPRFCFMYSAPATVTPVKPAAKPAPSAAPKVAFATVLSRTGATFAASAVVDSPKAPALPLASAKSPALDATPSATPDAAKPLPSLCEGFGATFTALVAASAFVARPLASFVVVGDPAALATFVTASDRRLRREPRRVALSRRLGALQRDVGLGGEALAHLRDGVRRLFRGLGDDLGRAASRDTSSRGVPEHGRAEPGERARAGTDALAGARPRGRIHGVVDATAAAPAAAAAASAAPDVAAAVTASVATGAAAATLAAASAAVRVDDRVGDRRGRRAVRR